MGIEKPFDRLTRLILNERPFDPESRDQTSLLLALANSLPAKFLVPAVIAALDIGGRRNANTVLARLGRRIRGAQAEVNDAILKTEDEWKRRRVICSLAPYLNRESLQRCIQSINGPLYAREYAQIHQFLPPENRVELLSKRLDAFTRGGGDFLAGDELVRVAEYLPDSLLTKSFEDSLTATAGFDEHRMWNRGKRLWALIPYLSAETYPRVIEASRHLNAEDRAQILLEVARNSRIGRAAIVAEAISEARRAGNDAVASYCLANAARMVRRPDRYLLATEALDRAARIWAHDDQLKILRLIIRLLPHDQVPRAYAIALAATRSLSGRGFNGSRSGPGWWDREEAYPISFRDRVRRRPLVPPPNLRIAISKAASGLRDPVQSAQASAEIARHLSGRRKQKALRSALATVTDQLSQKEGNRDDSDLVNVLWGILPQLSGKLLDIAVSEAHSLAASAARESWQGSEVLRSISPFLKKRHVPSWTAIATALHDPVWRLEGLLALLPKSSGAVRKRLLERTVRTAESFRRDPWQIVRLAPYLSEKELRSLAAQISASSESNVPSLLATLAASAKGKFRSTLLARALEVARSHEDPELRAISLSHVYIEARFRQKALVREILSLARQIPDERSRLHILDGLSSSVRNLSIEGIENRLDVKLLTRQVRSLLRGIGDVERDRLLTEVFETMIRRLQDDRSRGAAGGGGLEQPEIPGGPPDERVVNTGFASCETPSLPRKPDQPLCCGTQYLFWLEVGPAVADSIEVALQPLPTADLPTRASLTVALFSVPEEIEISRGADMGRLTLELNGDVSVEEQPTTMRPDGTSDALLLHRLFFPIRAPRLPGTCHVQCNIYCNQVLIQCRTIRARVMLRPGLRDDALQSFVTYTLSRSLKLEELPFSDSHCASMSLSDVGEGTHQFSFFSHANVGEFKNSVAIQALELQDMIEQGRNALRLAAWGREGPWQQETTYRYSGRFDLPRLRTDLVRFATRGFRFYDAVINRFAGGAKGAKLLRETMLTPGFAQVALRRSASLTIPAALIYDYKLDTGADLGDFKLCEEFVDALQRPASLEECSCFQGTCPTQGGNGLIICPSGFWGFRHAIGLPLSLPSAPAYPRSIVYGDSAKIAVCVSTDPALVLRARHEQDIRRICDRMQWHYASTRVDTIQLLKGTQPHLVYLYCHGGISKNVPFIKVGSQIEMGITRDNLRNEEICWDETRPLVFINGCHTTDVEPERALEFVSAFVENAYACGVIGTEITVFEPLATTFANEFLCRFVTGAPVGIAVKGARLALLKQGNPLGLSYVPFTLASIALAKSGAS